MAFKVGIYDSPQVAVQGSPVVREQNLPDNGLGAIGQGLAQVSQEVAREQRQADALVVSDASNDVTRAMINLRDNPNGGYKTVLEGGVIYDQDGKPFKESDTTFAKGYENQFSQAIETASGKLTSPYQKQLFKQRMGIMQNEFSDGLMQHTNDQALAYGKSVAREEANLAIQYVAKDWQNQNSRDVALTMVDGSAAKLASLTGRPVEFYRKQLRSRVHSAILEQSLDPTNTNYGFAETYFNANRKDMDVSDVLNYQAKVGTAGIAAQSQAAISAAKQDFRTNLAPTTTSALLRAGQIATASTGFDAASEATMKIEGGYNPSDGITKAPVNFGINQAKNPDIDVAKLTKADAKKLYKERYWDAIGGDNLQPGLRASAFDSAVNAGVGWTKQALDLAGGDLGTFNDLRRKHYQEIAAKNPKQAKNLTGWLNRVKDDTQENFLAQMQAFDNNEYKALAALKVGPAAVKKAVVEYDSEAVGAGDKYGWLKKLPQEVQDYVTKTNFVYESKLSQPPMPTESQFVDRVLGNLPAGASPMLIAKANESAKAEYAVLEKSHKAIGEQATARVYHFIESGYPFDKTPMEDRMNVPWEKEKELRAYAQIKQSGDDVKTNPAVYMKLTNEPEYLRDMSDDAWFAMRGALSPSHFQHFTQERAKLKGLAPGERPDDLDTGEVSRILANRLPGIGLSATPSNSDTNAHARLGAVRMFIDEQLLRYQKDVATKLHGKELEIAVDKIFAHPGPIKDKWFQWARSEDSQPLVATSIGDIPSDIKDSLSRDITRRTGVTPTDTDILRSYLLWKGNADQPKAPVARPFKLVAPTRPTSNRTY